MTEKKKTLLVALQPLIFSFNLVYGFNFGNRKPPGCVKRMYKMLRKQFTWLMFLLSAYIYCKDKWDDPDQLFDVRWPYMLMLFCCSFRLFTFDEAEVGRLILRLERYEIGQCSRKAMSKMTRLFLFTLALLSIPTLRIMTWYKLSDIIALIKVLNEMLSDPKQCTSAVVILVVTFLVPTITGCVVFLTVSVLLFPVFVAFFCCVLVIYGPSRLDDHVEDILRAHSPLRRAILLSKLCHDYDSLASLASMTNDNTAATMSLFKLFTMLQWALCCRLVENCAPDDYTMEILLFMPIMQFSIPLLIYLRVAPSANDMQINIFKCAAEVLMVDDAWQLHDPASCSLMARLRLNLLQHLVHIRMDEGPFTLLGDSVDPETLFMIFGEANDLRSVLR